MSEWRCLLGRTVLLEHLNPCGLKRLRSALSRAARGIGFEPQEEIRGKFLSLFREKSRFCIIRQMARCNPVVPIISLTTSLAQLFFICVLQSLQLQIIVNRYGFKHGTPGFHAPLDGVLLSFETYLWPSLKNSLGWLFFAQPEIKGDHQVS